MLNLIKTSILSAFIGENHQVRADLFVYLNHIDIQIIEKLTGKIASYV